MNKFKINKTSGILRVNNQSYIPHQLHQIPTWYHKIPLSSIIKMKGYVYINSIEFPNSKEVIECTHHNRDLNYKNKK